MRYLGNKDSIVTEIKKLLKDKNLFKKTMYYLMLFMGRDRITK